MKKQKLFITILAGLVLCVLIAPVVFAADGIGQNTDPAKVSVKDFESLLVNIINWLLGFAAVAATAIIVVGGYMLLSSRGNANDVEKGKEIIKGGIIGLVMIILAAVLVNTIIAVLGK